MSVLISNDNLTFVFASGGSLGAVRVNALAANGIQASCAEGSFGAIKADYYAADPISNEISRIAALDRSLFTHMDYRSHRAPDDSPVNLIISSGQLIQGSDDG